MMRHSRKDLKVYLIDIQAVPPPEVSAFFWTRLKPMPEKNNVKTSGGTWP